VERSIALSTHVVECNAACLGCGDLSRAVVLPALVGGDPRLQLGDLTSKHGHLVAFADQFGRELAQREPEAFSAQLDIAEQQSFVGHNDILLMRSRDDIARNA
jgi:hypothetical protein